MTAPERERQETPLDLFVLADLLPGAGAETPLRARPHRVDVQTLDALQAEAAPAVTVPGPGGGELELVFPTLKSFRPEALARALPALQALAGARRVLDDLHRGRTTPEAARAALGALPPGAGDLARELGDALAGEPGGSEAAPEPERPAKASASPPEAPSGGLFDLVDVEGSAAAAEASGPPPGAERALERLVRELAGGRGTPLNTRRLAELTARLDDAAADAVREVLHHPRVRDLEAAWRGVHFLLRRLDPRSGIRIHLLAVPPGDRVRALEEIVLPAAGEARREARTVLVLVDADFGAGPGSLAEALELARRGEEGRVPVLASADPALLGLDSWKSIQELGPVDEILEESPPEGWRELRAEPAARWLTLFANPFLLRLPYGAELDRVKGFAFEENPAGAEPVHLWGRPAWLAASLLAESAIRDGWGTDFTGPAAAATVEDLPVRPLVLRGGDPVQVPLEMLLPENRVLELSRAGIAALACARNRDTAFLPTAPGVARPVRGEGASDTRTEALRVGLPYQVFTARITALLDHLLAWMQLSGTPAELAGHLATGLEVLTAERERAGVEVAWEAPEEPGEAASITLRVIPRAEAVRGLPVLELQLPFSRGGS